ncbi:MAG TPA: hypothetical protein VGV18_02545, partial [Verrucomicrobiae bacterium]|nr:hypothetical protein [Verrucomicrobiae bacterium]
MRAGTRHLIPFFWQAVFILLPVTLLAIVSLVSLRRDAQRAEQDARNRAAQDVQSLARAVRASVNDELQRLLALQNKWTQGLMAVGQPTITGVFPDPKLKSAVEKWEQDYPEQKFAELATPQAEILTDGRQIDPPEISTVPTPPNWFRELSPEQEELWEQLRRAVDAKEKHESIQKASEAFVNSRPSPNADHASLWLTAPAADVAGDSGAFPTETGLSFQEIACYQMLSAKNAKLNNSLVQSVWWRIIDHPSFISARLLKFAEALTNEADSSLSQKVYWMHQFWDEQSKVRAWMDQLRRVSNGSPFPGARRSDGQAPRFEELDNRVIGSPWTAWANVPDFAALAVFNPCEFGNVGYDSDTGPFSGPGYRVWFVPRKVVDAIFRRALQENKVFIPDYETAAVTVEGEPSQAFYPLPQGRGSVQTA